LLVVPALKVLNPAEQARDIIAGPILEWAAGDDADSRIGPHPIDDADGGAVGMATRPALPAARGGVHGVIRGANLR
jgi:hypothetical protein